MKTIGVLAFLFLLNVPANFAAEPMRLLSPAFKEGESIPQAYTCEGKDRSPALKWTNEPAGTQSFTIIVDDPDAPFPQPWVHWVIFNIPPGVKNLPEAMPNIAVLANSEKQGNNGWGKYGYGGPCPPSGNHRYYFKLYALDTALMLDAGANKDDVLKAMEGHVLAEAQLMGRYEKVKK